MTRRTVAAAVVVATLALVACGGDGDDVATTVATTLDLSADPTVAPAASAASPADDLDPPPATADTNPWLLTSDSLQTAAGVPRLLVSDGSTVFRVARGVRTVVYVAEGSIGDAFGVGDGDVVVEQRSMVGDDDVVSGVVVVGADGAARSIPLAPHRAVDVFDVVEVGGAPAMVYALFEQPASAVESTFGRLVLQDLASGEVSELGLAAGPEYLVTAVSASSGLLVRTAIDGLGETIDTIDYTGVVVDRPSPTDGADVAGPPAYRSAVLSPDGTELAFLEGPGFAGPDDADAETLLGDWEVVIDQGDGEQLRLVVADQTITQASVDFDGRWLLVSGRTATGPVVPLLIDSEDPALPAYLVDTVVGHARLESAAAR